MEVGGLVINAVRFQVGLHGLTGHIEFKEGKRHNFKLDLLKLKKEQLRKVGQWSPSKGINITDPTAFYETTSTNITLIVMTREVRQSFLFSRLQPFPLERKVKDIKIQSTDQYYTV